MHDQPSSRTAATVPIDALQVALHDMQRAKFFRRANLTSSAIVSHLWVAIAEQCSMESVATGLSSFVAYFRSVLVAHFAADISHSSWSAPVLLSLLQCIVRWSGTGITTQRFWDVSFCTLFC
jgi:VIT1/CCC1 family predicted Fe2+/Mn2+ transporter